MKVEAGRCRITTVLYIHVGESSAVPADVSVALHWSAWHKTHGAPVHLAQLALWSSSSQQNTQELLTGADSSQSSQRTWLAWAWSVFHSHLICSLSRHPLDVTPMSPPPLMSGGLSCHSHTTWQLTPNHCQCLSSYSHWSFSQLKAVHWSWMTERSHYIFCGYICLLLSLWPLLARDHMYIVTCEPSMHGKGACNLKPNIQHYLVMLMTMTPIKYINATSLCIVWDEVSWYE